MSIFHIYAERGGSVCVTGLPGSGKSRLSRELVRQMQERGVAPPPKLLALVDAISANGTSQQQLLDLYGLIVKEGEATPVFDGWPAEAALNQAVRLCNQVWLLCCPPWLHRARLAARRSLPLDEGFVREFYEKTVPDWIERYRDSGKLLLLDTGNGSPIPIADYPGWLAATADAGPEDERSLVLDMRGDAYQSFVLPFGGRITGSDATEQVVRRATEHLPDPVLLRSAVDVGCNLGQAAFILSEWGIEDVRGIDPDPVVIRTAQRLRRLYQSPVEFDVARGELYSFEGVGLAVCLSVAHHLAEPRYLYAPLMRARWILVELPHHKFSVVEEAAQRLDRECIAAWPSPKRDREVRLYCAREEMQLATKTLEPGSQRSDVRVAYQRAHDSRFAEGDSDEGLFYCIAQNEHDWRLVYGSPPPGDVWRTEHDRFLCGRFLPPEGTSFVECSIEFASVKQQFANVQLDWGDRSGALKMVARPRFFQPGQSLTVVSQNRPPGIGEVRSIRVSIRPSPSASLDVRRVSLTAYVPS